MFVLKKLSDQYYLEEAPIRKMMMHLSIPMMIGMSVGTIYNVINAYFIGMLHNTQMMSAITLGLPIFTVLMALGNVFGVGGGTFITRLISQNETECAKKIAGYTFYGSLISGILFAILAFFIADPVVSGLGADQMTYLFTKQYVLMLSSAGFMIIVNFALEQLVRALGASKESMYGIFIATGLSLILDPLLILGFGWPVAGAALAMALSNLGSAIYYIYFLEKRSTALSGFMKHFFLSVREQLEIYKIGMAELFQSAFMIVSTLLLNHFAIFYGDDVVAGFGIALRIVQIPEFLTMGLFLGLIPFFAFNYGKPNIKRLKAGIRAASVWIAAISILFVGIVYIFRTPIFALFTTDKELLTVGTLILVAMLISALFNGFTGLFMGIFQATGQGTPTTILAILQGVLYIPIIFILHMTFGLHGVIWSMTVTEIITCLVGIVLFIPFQLQLNKKAIVTNEA